MEKDLKLDNYHFSYYAVGNPNHPVILFLHGFMGNRHEFDRAIAALCDRFYCVAIDLPGHGQTEVLGSDRDYTIANTAEGLIKFLEALNIARCFLIGYSMGGRLALYLALHFPKYFQKVLLESASPGLRTEEERLKRYQSDIRLAEDLESSNLSQFLSKWYSQPIFSSLRSHPHFEKMLEQKLKNSPYLLAKSLCNFSVGLQHSLWENLKTNQIPLLLLVGELDTKFVDINKEMADLSEFTELKIVENCSHNIHFENSDVFIQQIIDFIR